MAAAALGTDCSRNSAVLVEGLFLVPVFGSVCGA